MTEKRQIDDDELVEITGAGEFDAFVDRTGSRPAPGIGGGAGSGAEPEDDNEPSGDQESGEA